MKFRRLYSLLATKSALSTLILIVPLVMGVWESLNIFFKAGLIALLAILNFYFVYYEYKQPDLEIENMLELMVKSLWGPENSSHFRSNVMIYNYKTGKLYIKHQYNMMGAVDRDFEVDLDQGCAGRAFCNRVPFWVDIPKSTHEQYYVDSGQVWSSMKSVMSVPILLQRDIIGVLNIDSDLGLSMCKFDQEKVYIVVNAYSDMIARVLERRL